MIRSFFLLALVVAVPAGAQNVPLIAVDFTVGGGPSTVWTPRADYFRDLELIRVAATVRLGNAGRIRPIVTGELSDGCLWLDVCGDKTFCEMTPRGGCRAHLSGTDGFALGAGVAARVARPLMVQAVVGASNYWDRGRFAEIEVGLSPFSHFAIVVSARHIIGHDNLGDNVWFFARSLGIRIY